MINEPMDISQEWPKVMTRQAALERLQEILGSLAVEQVWNEIVGPLYDLRRAQAEYPNRGRCTCGARHPAWSLPPGKTEKANEHRMQCRHYVGPLEHETISSENATYTGVAMSRCKCGRAYSFWVDENEEPRTRASCPDAHLSWRGPRT